MQPNVLFIPAGQRSFGASFVVRRTACQRSGQENSAKRGKNGMEVASDVFIGQVGKRGRERTLPSRYRGGIGQSIWYVGNVVDVSI